MPANAGRPKDANGDILRGPPQSYGAELEPHVEEVYQEDAVTLFRDAILGCALVITATVVILGAAKKNINDSSIAADTRRIADDAHRIADALGSRHCIEIKPKPVDKSMDELAEAAARATDAYICGKATEPWQVKAFCK